MAPPVVAVAGVAPRRTWWMESAADERRNGFTSFSTTEPSISGVKETAVYRRQESPLPDRAKCGAMPRPATSLEQHFTKPLTQVHHQILHAEEKKRPKEKEEEEEQLLSEEGEEQLLSEEEVVQQLGEHKYSMLSSQQRETNAARSSPAGAALWRCFSGAKSFIKAGGTSALKSITRQTTHVEDRLQPPSTPGYAIVEDDVAGRKAARHICLLPSSQHVGDQQEFPMFLTIPCPACRHPPLFGSFVPAFGCPLPLGAAAAGQQPDQQPDKRPQDIRFAIRDSSCVHVAGTTPTTTTSSSTNGLHSRSAACLPLSPLNKLNEERLSAQVGEEKVNGCKTASSFTCTACSHSVKLTAASQPVSDAGEEELLVNTKPVDSNISREGDYAISTDHHYYTATTAATVGAAALGQECAAAEQIPERFEQQVLSDEDHHQQQSSCQYCRDTGFANLHVSSVCLPRLRRGKKQAELWGLYYRLEGAKQTLMWSHDSGTDIGYLHRNSSLLCFRLRVNLFVYDYSGYGCSTPYHDPTSSVSRSRKRWLPRKRFFSRNPHNDEALFQDLLLRQQQETSGVQSSPYLPQYQPHSLLPESSSQQQQQQMKRHTLDEASEDISTAVRARRSPVLSTEKHALLQLQQQHGSEKEASRRAACTGELSCSIADSAEPAADSFEPPAASCSYLSSAPSSPLQQQERLQRTAAAAACVSLEMGEEAATLSPAAVRDEDSRRFRFPKPWAGRQLGSDAAAAYYWLLKEGKARPCDIILFGDGLGVAATLVVLRRITREQKRLRKQLRRECIPASSSACLSRFSRSHSCRSSDSEQLCMEQQLLQLLSNEAATGGKNNKRTQHQTGISSTNSLPSAAAAAEQTEEHRQQQQQQQQKQQQQENDRKGRRYMDEKRRRLRVFLSRRRAAVRRQKVVWRRRTRRLPQRQQRKKSYVRRNSLLLSDEEVSHWRSRPEPRSRFMKTRVSLYWKRFFNSSNAAATAADPAEMCSPLLGGVLLVASATWSWVQQQQQGRGGGDGRDNAGAEEKQGRDGFTKWQPEKQQKKEEDTSRRVQCRGSRRARVSAAAGLPYFRNASRSVHHYCRPDRAAAEYKGECCCRCSRSSSCVDATRHGAAVARCCCCCSRSRDPASASSCSCCCCCSSGASATAADRTSATGNCSCCFACAFEEADRRCEFVWQSRDLLLQPRFCWGSATTLEAKLQRLSAAPLLLLQSAPLREECEEAADRQLHRGGPQTQNCLAAAAATEDAPAAGAAGKGGVGVGRVCGISAGSCSTVASSGTTVGLTTGPVCQKNLSCCSDSSRKEEEEEIQLKWVSALRRRGAGSRSSSCCVSDSFAAAQAWLLQSMEAFVHETATQHKLLQRLCSKCCRAKTLEKNQEKEETVDREMGGEYLSLQQQQEKKQEEEKQQQQDNVLATGGERGGGGGGTKGLLPLQQWLSHRFGESEEQQRKVGDTGVSPLKKQQKQSPLKKKKGFLGGKRKKGSAASFISYGVYNEDEADTAEDEEEYRTAARTGTTTSAGKTKFAAATGSVKDSSKNSIARLLPSSATIERRRAGRGGDWDVTMGRERRQQQQEKQQQEDQSSADIDRSNSTTKSRFFSFRRRRSPPTAAGSEETGGVGNRGGRWLSLTGKPGTQSMSTLFDASAAKEEDNEDHESTTPSAHRVSSPVRRRVEAAARRRGEDTGVKRRGSGDSQSSNSSSPHSSHSVVGGVEEEECAHAAVVAATSDSSALRT